MNKHLVFVFFLALFMMPFTSFSQFTISAELRPRFEMDNGAMRPIPDSLDTRYFVTQRTRLIFDFNKEKYQFRLSLQDVRFWGNGDIYSSTGVWGSTGGVDIQEAWFRLKIGEYSNITIGRQMLKLDEQRLMATRNWNQFGISYDAVSFVFAKNDWILNAAVSYNTNTEVNNGKVMTDPEFFNAKNIMKTQNYIHLMKKFNKNFSASFIALASGYQH